jgi:hypothetical protein
MKWLTRDVCLKVSQTVLFVGMAMVCVAVLMVLPPIAPENVLIADSTWQHFFAIGRIGITLMGGGMAGVLFLSPDKKTFLAHISIFTRNER